MPCCSICGSTHVKKTPCGDSWLCSDHMPEHLNSCSLCAYEMIAAYERED
jgi:hypothetical protein